MHALYRVFQKDFFNIRGNIVIFKTCNIYYGTLSVALKYKLRRSKQYKQRKSREIMKS